MAHGPRFDSVWLDDPSRPSAGAPFDGDADVDVAIVGAGITGLSTACHLRARLPDLDVVVLEADRVGAGASGRSSGALTVIPERRFAAKLPRDGEAETRRAIAFQAAGVETVARLVREGSIDCGFGPRGYLILGQERHARALQREAAAMTRLGIDGRYLEADDVRAALDTSGFYTVGVRGPACWMNPARYVWGLAAVARTRGAQIYERSRVRRVTPGRPTTLRLDGCHVRARTVVLATNASTSKLGFLRRRVWPMHTHVISTEPLAPELLQMIGWRHREIVFEADRGGDTFLLTPDGRLYFRGLVRYRFGDGLRPLRLDKVAPVLAAEMAERLPQLKGVPISHCWGGVIGMTRSFRPAIGRLAGDHDVLYAAGYSGHGLAYASLAGRLMAELVAGDRSPELDYALEHSLPPAMPVEPLRWATIQLAARVRSRKG